jgi:pimeloyl-ACP methyl ester carboxylesterase
MNSRHLLSAVMLCAAVVPAGAQAPWSGTLRVALPVNLVDSLDGAKFRIRIPGNWNGTLLIYLQGSKTGAAPAEPLIAPPVLPGAPALEDTLISRGYGLAASEVTTTEWQQKAEVQDTFALVSYFRGRVGEPKRVILLGTSLGGLAALRLMEEAPRSFDGALAMCAPAAGNPMRMDRTLDFALAYATVFGWPEDKWGAIDDLKEGLNFARDVNPVVPWPKPDGSNKGQWELIRLASSLGSDAFWKTDPIQGVPGYVIEMLWTTQQRQSVESWAMGPVVQNLDHGYGLRPDEKTYLASLGVNADELLAKLNSRPKIAPCARCRDFVYRFATVRGALTKPVLTMHTTSDGLAEIDNEGFYRDAVESWGCSKNLAQAFVSGVGHCAFTGEQVLTALAALEKWLDTGTRPDAASFPASQGFNSQFVPPRWPY